MVAERVAFIAPNRPAPKGEEMEKFGRADKVTRTATWFPRISLGVDYICHLCELAAILAREYPSPLSDKVLATLFKDPSAAERLEMSPIYLAGCILLVSSGVIRQWCYDTLGTFFTFQLALFKEHKLVTSGPYAIVRHPSYTSLVMGRLGLALVQVFPGSYLHESGLLETRSVAILVGLWELWIIAIVVEVITRRVPREDGVLRQEFGRQWDEWAKTTPYKLIPYVY
ncbi:hypothetical protein BD309DRAFT_987847 [Dichomitus squalens]|nr:hypothetical protein BD309DRAFT_987847 [Dichomitus squalens]